jgi:hypothetical protein
MPTETQDLINFLKNNKFKAECPSCRGKMDLAKTPLFDADHFTPKANELLNEIKNGIKER